MSVLFKNMEIPVDCRDCPFEMFYNNCGETRCRANNEILAVDYMAIPFSGRPDWCPIIELPPHGRLIDADEMVASVKRQTEIMREIAKEVDKLKPIANSKELDDVDIVAIAETVEKGVLQEIANAPTILEAEEGET